ncbi:hypothetical protein BDZ94DRAFT_1269339 [Collybia nuda]|uniref:Uncharacterized protein n=1 Tax=Collybia nuda TaxID=64659 RepID=A0A9P5XYA3_9AGAR|nr:hypothetical protein BDZ94DRAFT_1269339 [Collybia nuda]
MACLTALNDDVLIHLIETLSGPDSMKRSDSHVGLRMQKLHLEHVGTILPLSSTCKRMRTALFPLLFREEKYWRTKMVHLPDDRKIWPCSIWKHIVELHLKDKDDSQFLIDYAPLKAAFPDMHALKKIRFRFTMTPPATLLFAASLAPRVDTLEFTSLRIDDPFVIQSFFNFPRLTSLSMSINSPENVKEDLREKEISNVAHILRTLSEQLLYLEIPGGLIEFSTLMEIDWPLLRDLVILNNMPRGPVAPLSYALSTMPCLRTLVYSFATEILRLPHPVFGFLTPQTQEFQPIVGKDHPHLPPRLISVNLSSPPPQYPMYDHLSYGLEVLRIFPYQVVGLILPHDFQEMDISDLLTKASRFEYLRELALTLKESPSPSILTAIAKACPSILVLEVGQTTVSEREPEHDIQSLIDPLTQMTRLRELRIAVELGPGLYTYQSLGSYGVLDRTELENRLQSTAEAFAQRLTKLNVISLLRKDEYDLGPFGQVTGRVAWHRSRIHTSARTGGPLVEFDKLYKPFW